MAEGNSLAPLLETHRVVVCLGAGGVGKTTVAAALALAAAQSGKRTLCLTIDPARRLANSLGLERFDSERVEVSREWLAERGVELRGPLTVMMLDTKRTFDELVERHAPTPEARNRILGNRLYQYVSAHLAGTQSYMAMEKVLQVEQDEQFDTIVLDTPPMQNALDFFEAPERLVQVIDSPALRGLVQALSGGGRFSLNLVAQGLRLVLRTIGRVTGVELLEEMAGFVSSMNDLFGGFHDRAEAVAERMRSSGFGYVLVSAPSESSLRDAGRMMERMADWGLHPGAMVINRVHPSAGAVSTPEELLAYAQSRGLGWDADAAERIHRAACEEAELASQDQLELGQARRWVGADIARQVIVPAFAVDVHHPERLEEVAQYLTRAS